MKLRSSLCLLAALELLFICGAADNFSQPVIYQVVSGVLANKPSRYILEDPQGADPSVDANSTSIFCKSCTNWEECSKESIPDVKCPENSTGCMTSFLNSLRTKITFMGCTSKRLSRSAADTDQDDNCDIATDGQMRCYCSRDRCNYNMETQETNISYAIPTIFDCWTCDSMEACNAPLLNQTKCNPVVGDDPRPNSCMIAFQSIEDVRTGQRVIFRGCGVSPVTDRPIHCTKLSDTSKGAYGCFCFGEHCNYRLVRNSQKTLNVLSFTAILGFCLISRTIVRD